MADNEYRDPKVTAAPAKSKMSPLWWIILGLVALAILAWIFGLFDNDTQEVAVPVDNTVVEQPVEQPVVEQPVVEPVTPVTPAPAD